MVADDFTNDFIQLIDDQLKIYKRYGMPQTINGLQSVVEEARLYLKDSFNKHVFPHLSQKLCEVGEGYTLYESLGYKDPLASLGIKQEDYITNKAKKVEELLAKKPVDYELKARFHLEEISAVGSKYKIDVLELVTELTSRLMNCVQVNSHKPKGQQ